MVTGIEVASLILGALPLIISALEHYNDSLKPFKDFVIYKPLIQRLACDLQTQRTRLKLTCELLLISLDIPYTELQALLEDPTTSAWSDQSLVQQLKTRLQDSYITFLKLLGKLAASLENLAGRIGLNAAGQPLPDYLKKRKRYWKRFRTCLSLQEHEALISQLRNDNDDLHNLIEVSLHLEIQRSQRSIQKGALNQIRDCADRLHGALRSCWSCNCSAPHNAELRLEKRDWEQPPCFRVTFPVSTTPSHMVPSTWHETEIKTLQRPTTTRPIVTDDGTAHCGALVSAKRISGSTVAAECVPESPHGRAPMITPSPSYSRLKIKGKKSVAWAITEPGVQAANLHLADLQAARRPPAVIEEAEDIHDLCSVLRCERHQSSNLILGRFLHEQSRYELISISQQGDADNRTSTFHELLLNHNGGASLAGINASPIVCRSSRNPPRLSKKARLELAVVLASTALQLHTTPWLDRDWSGRNVYFRQGSLDRPFVSRALTESKTPTIRSPGEEWGPIRNQSIFALGVMLLELSLRAPLEQIKISKEQQQQQPQPQQHHSDLDDYVTASRSIKDVADEEGKSSGYYGATQACIFCNFGPKVKDLDLANDAFRQAVYEDVILPLQRDLEYFCKGP